MENARISADRCVIPTCVYKRILSGCRAISCAGKALSIFSALLRTAGDPLTSRGCNFSSIIGSDSGSGVSGCLEVMAEVRNDRDSLFWLSDLFLTSASWCRNCAAAEGASAPRDCVLRTMDLALKEVSV